MNSVDACNQIARDLRENIVEDLQQQHIYKLEKIEIYSDNIKVFDITDINSKCWVSKTLETPGDISFIINYI